MHSVLKITSNICLRFWWFLFWPRSKSRFAGCTLITIVQFVGNFVCGKNMCVSFKRITNLRIIFVTRSFSGLEFHCWVNQCWPITIWIFNERIRTPNIVLGGEIDLSMRNKYSSVESSESDDGGSKEFVKFWYSNSELLDAIISDLAKRRIFKSADVSTRMRGEIDAWYEHSWIEGRDYMI